MTPYENVTFKERLHEEAAKLKEMSFKDKFWYIWEYYKFPIIGVIIAVFLVGSIGSAMYNNRFDTALSCAVLNSRYDSDALTVDQYFNEGFGATDYATAQSMFLDGKSAMYYIGDWEQAAMLDAYNAGKVDYFYLPTAEGAKTGANEFCVNSGIGMAFNTQTFDAKTKDFIKYVIENYGKIYAGRMQMSPIKTELPEDIQFTDLYLRIREDMEKTGKNFLKPWDTYLDVDTNTVMQDNMLLLAAGDMTVDDFIKIVDDAIASNVK